MNGDLDLKDKIQSIIQEFERYFLIETIKHRQKGEDVSVNFKDFISLPQYHFLKIELDEYIFSNGLEQLVFENLTPEQKKRIGGLFHIANEESKFYNPQILSKQVNVIDNGIINSIEYKDFMKIRDSLTENERERMASNLAKLLYNKIGEKEKKLISEGTIKRYLMCAGFIDIKRTGYKELINFVKQYPPLFLNEEEVLSSILGRYVDEELTRTPVSETKERIRQLKDEIKKLYESIK